MAKSHERVIVDVRDLFGQAKEKIDLPPPADTARPGEGPGGEAGGLFSGPGGGWGNGALGEYKPKTCVNSNDNVFFGPPPSGRGKGTRTRRQIPGAPVLIDVDVGIDAQLLGGDGRDVTGDVTGDYTTQTDKSWNIRSTPPPPPPPPPPPLLPIDGAVSGGRGEGGRGGQPGPPGGGGAMSRTVASEGSWSPGVNTNGHQTVMNGRAPGTAIGNKYEGRGLPSPPGSAANIPPPPPPPPPPLPPLRGARPSGPCVTSALMSKFRLNAKTPAAPCRPDGAGPLRAGRGGWADRDSANSKASLDQSSSGVETDENTTPEATLLLQPARTAGPAAPAEPTSHPGRPELQPPPPANGGCATEAPPDPPPASRRDSSYHSATGSDEDDADAVTLDFDSEEEGEDDDGADFKEGHNRKSLYPEYQGDDYGQFLKEDQAAEPGGATSAHDRKKSKRRRKKKDVGQVTPGSTVSSTGNASSSKKRTLKGRIAAVFMGSVNGTSQKALGKPKARSVDTGSTIHSFSFADSKIGNYMTSDGLAADSRCGAVASTSGSGSADDLAYSDAAYGGDRKWWSADTLSARTLSSNSDVMLRSRRPSAVPAHDNFIFKSAEFKDRPRAESLDGWQAGGDSAENGVGTGGASGADFESQRKSVIYGLDTNSKKAGRHSIFRRFKKDSKTGLADPSDNTVVNPLTAAMGGDANNTQF